MKKFKSPAYSYQQNIILHSTIQITACRQRFFFKKKRHFFKKKWRKLKL